MKLIVVGYEKSTLNEKPMLARYQAPTFEKTTIKMKKIILFIFFIGCLSARAQNWEIKYKSDSALSNNCVIHSINSGYLIAGRSTKDYNGLYGGIFIFKIDENGDTLWTKFYGDFNNSNRYPEKIIEDNNGNFYICGRFYVYSQNYGPGGVFLIKFDSSGNLLWSKRYSDSLHEFQYYRSFIKTSDDKLLILCAASTWQNPNVAQYLVKTDSNGNLEWSKTFECNVDVRLTAITETPSGDYTISAYKFDSLVPLLSGTHYTSIVLLKIDTIGNLIWAKNYSHTPASIQFNISLITTNTGFIVYGHTENYLNHLLPYTYLIKMDFDGNYQWFYKYDSLSNPTLYQDANQNLFVAGSSRNQPTLVKLDSSGNQIWSRRYYTASYYIKSMDFNSTGLIISVDNSRYTHLIKLDADGNNECYRDSTSFNQSSELLLDTTISFTTNPLFPEFSWTPTAASCVLSKQQLCTIVSVAENKNILFDFSIFPNPSSGIFTISLSKAVAAKIWVHDVLGNCLLNKDCGNDLNQKIDLTGKSNGIYFLEIMSEGEKVVKKIVLE